jgi:hypothetical protein
LRRRGDAGVHFQAEFPDFSCSTLAFSVRGYGARKERRKMKNRISMTWPGAIALLLAGNVAPAATVRTPEIKDSEQVSKLLSEAKTMAFQLREDAAQMETFTHLDVSWESHAAAINQIKEHVNLLARQEAKLQAAKNTASPWQKTAIDRISPFLDELGGYTSAAIEHVNKKPAHTMAEYRDYLEANADYSSDLATMISQFVDYGRSKQRMDRLAAKLEIPAGK